MRQTTTLTPFHFWKTTICLLGGLLLFQKMHANPTATDGPFWPKISPVAPCDLTEPETFQFGQMTWRDVDGDGDADLILTSFDGGAGLRVYQNGGAPDFVFQETTAAEFAKNPRFASDFFENQHKTIADYGFSIEKMLASTAGNTGPYAQSETIQLFASHGLSWSWSGPGGFTSTLQNPTRTSATTAMSGTYTVTVTLTGGVTETATTSVTVNPAVIICHGQTAKTFSISAVSGATSYTWTIGNDAVPTSIVSGQGTTSITVDLTQLTDGNHLVSVVANGASCSSFPTSVLITLPPILNVSASNGGPYCVGGTLQLNSTPSGGTSPYTYAWSGPTTFSPTNVQNPSFTATTTAFNGTYTVTVTDANGCTKTASTTVTVVADPTVSVSVAAPTICAGGTTTLTATVSGGTGTPSYQWQSGSSSSGPWTNVGTNSSSYTTAALSSTTYYQVLITQTGGGCDATGTATVTVVPVQSITISGATTICTGGTATLTATGSNGTGTCTIAWEKSTDGGTTWASAGSGNSISPTNITATTIFRANYACTGNNCGSTVSSTQTVTVVADPSISINEPDQTICTGGSLTLTTTEGGGTGTCTLSWEKSTDGGTTWASAGPNGTSLATGVLTQTTKYRVTKTCTGNDCNTAVSVVKTITVIADPVASSPVASTSVCQGGSVTLTSTVTGGTGTFSYQWEQSANGTSGWVNAVGGTGATTTSYSPPTSTVGTLYYRMNASQTGNGCSNAISSNAQVDVVPAATVTSSGGDLTICTGGTVSFSATYTNGTGTPSWQWQSSPDGTTYTDISGATSSSYTASNITATTYYRAKLTLAGSGCGIQYSNVRIITVVADPSISINEPDQTICTGGSLTFTTTEGGGTGTCTLSWEKSTDGGTTWASAGPNGTSLATGVLTQTTKYRVTKTCTGNDCNTAVSVVKTITVVADPIIATQPVGDTVCVNGATSISVVASGGTGTFSYQWQSSTSAGGTYTNVATGGTAATYIPTTSSVGSIFYRVIVSQTGNDCNSITSSVVEIKVKAAPTLTISGATTICTGGAATLTSAITSGTGSVTYQWQYDNSGTWTNVATGGTSASLALTAQTTTRTYRLLVTISGSGCGSLTSNSQIITVVADPSISINEPDQTICTGGSLTFTTTEGGGTGTCTLSWEKSTDGGTTWASAGPNGTSLATGVLTQTTKYRVTKSCTGNDCNTAVSVVKTITVIADPIASSPAASTSVCQGGSVTLTSTVTGGVGTFTYQWEQSANGTSGWVNAVGGTGATTTSYSPPTATVGTLYYRMNATQTGNGCSNAISSNAQVDVVPAATVTSAGGDLTLCTGGSASFSATYTNGTGTPSWQWQSSPDGTTYTDISGATSSSYTASNITATTWYRAKLTLAGSGCGIQYSNVRKITIVPDPSVSITGATTICIGGSATLSATVLNGTGTCGITWESSPDGTTWTLISGQTTSSLTISPTSTTQYRANYNCDGVGCNSSPSNTQTVTVVADPVIATQPAGDTVCVNGATSISVVASGGTGSFNYQWQSATTAGGTYTNLSGATSATYIPVTSAVGSIFYKVLISQTGVGCDPITSSVVEIKVKAAPTVTIAGSTTICSGGAATLTSSVSSGTGSVTYQWQYDNSGTWTNLGPGSTSASLSVSNLTATRNYRLIVTISGSGCGVITSNTQTVTVVADPSISVAVTGTNPICQGQTTTLTATTGGGTGGCTIQWQTYNTSTSAWEDISGANGTTYTTPVLTVSTQYRATYSCGGNGCDPATSPAVTVTVTPNPVVSIPPPPSICPGQGVTMTASVTGDPNDFTFQWQLSTDNSTWTDISGATQQSYTAAYLTTTTYFRVIVTRKDYPCTTTSASATVTVLPAPPKPGAISY